jgi:LPXTG-motif cell wall-anchored protein
LRTDGSVKRLLLSVAAIFAGGVASVSLTAPTFAAAVSGPVLQVSVVVTPAKATYAVGDAVTTTFVVTNTGTAIATNVHVTGGDEGGVDRATEPPADKFDLAPGESRSLPWAATINKDAATLGYAYGGLSFGDDQGQEAEGWYRIEPVPGMTGTLTGKIFVDLKGDFDSTQAGLAGVTVTATNNTSGVLVASTKTDNTGQFSMPNLAAGDYQVRVVGWAIKDADAGTDATLAQVKGGQTSRVYVAIVPGSGPKTTTAPATTASTSTATTPATSTATTTPTTTPTRTTAATPTATGAGSVSTSASGSSGGLPVTGSPTGLMTAIGAGLVLVGVAAVVVNRRRRDAVPPATDS